MKSGPSTIPGAAKDLLFVSLSPRRQIPETHAVVVRRHHEPAVRMNIRRPRLLVPGCTVESAQLPPRSHVPEPDRGIRLPLSELSVIRTKRGPCPCLKVRPAGPGVP